MKVTGTFESSFIKIKNIYTLYKLLWFSIVYKKFGNIRVQSKRSRHLKAYFLRARWFIYNCTTYLSSNWVVNLTNASAVSVQLSSTLKRRYSLQLEWQHRVYSVHSQHRAIQGDNYNVPYYSQLSLMDPFWTGVHLRYMSFSYKVTWMEQRKTTVILRCPV